MLDIGVVLATDHRFATWAEALLEALARQGVWDRSDDTICIIDSKSARPLTEDDQASLRKHCHLFQTRFRYDPDFSFLSERYVRTEFYTRTSHYKTAHLGEPWNKLVPYTFSFAWNRFDILVEPYFRRFTHVVYLDCDHRVVQTFSMSALAMSSGRLPLATQYVVGASTYRDLMPMAIKDSAVRTAFLREFPPSKAPPAFSNHMMIFNMSAVAPPNVTKARILGFVRALHATGLAVGRAGLHKHALLASSCPA